MDKREVANRIIAACGNDCSVCPRYVAHPYEKTEDELLHIFHAFCKPSSMKLSEDAERCVKAYLHWLVQNKSENFANGREMRNLFDLVYSNQANRLAEKADTLADLSNEELNEIAKDDLPVWVVHPQSNANLSCDNRAWNTTTETIDENGSCPYY